MIGYKVVSKDSIGFHSAMFNRDECGAVNRGTCLDYSIGKWTFPKIPNSRIFFFRNKKFAQKWANAMGMDIAVLKAEIKGKPVRVCAFADPLTNDVVDFWKDRDCSNPYDNQSNNNIPVGSFACDGVKPIEVIWES